jgi:predicted esterase
MPSERVMIVGFSQGACLTSEFAARHPRRYGGIAALIGGLIGPPGTPRDYPGSLDGTPIYLGSADPDPHVPWPRVEETAAVFERMGAAVSVERFPDAPHMIRDEHIERVRAMLIAITTNAI